MVQRYQISGPATGNPILRMIAVLAGIGLTVAGLFLGFFVFLIGGAVLLLGWGIFRLRLWWLRRQGRDPFEEFNQRLRESISGTGNTGSRTSGGRKDDGNQKRRGSTVIDGRYTVVDDDTPSSD